MPALAEPALRGSRPRALLTRHPHQGGGWAAALEEAGFECVLVLVIDAARSPEQAEAAAAVPGMLAEVRERTGCPALLTLTSPNTVRALFAAGAVGPVAEAQNRGAVIVAVVGEGTAAAAESVGLKADLLPSGSRSARMSAQGLVELVGQRLVPAGSWAEASSGSRTAVGGALLPQGDLAQPILAEGLRAQGFPVETVTVYSTVPVLSSFPASGPQTRGEPLPSNLPEDAANLAAAEQQGTRVLTPAEGAAEAWDVLIPTSPSALRGLASAGFALSEAPLVSLGPSTTRAAREIGVEPVEAEHPNAAGVAQAAAHAVGLS